MHIYRYVCMYVCACECIYARLVLVCAYSYLYLTNFQVIFKLVIFVIVLCQLHLLYEITCEHTHRHTHTLTHIRVSICEWFMSIMIIPMAAHYYCYYHYWQPLIMAICKYYVKGLCENGANANEHGFMTWKIITDTRSSALACNTYLVYI